MREFTIRLRCVDDVNEFVAIATRHFRVYVSDGQRTVDGKSIMEIFCLTLTNPITVTADCDEEEFQKLYQACERLLVK